MKTRPYVKPRLHRSIKIWSKNYEDLKSAAFYAGMTIVELQDKMITRELARQLKHSALAVKSEDSTGESK